jgi:hypothetical protein
MSTLKDFIAQVRSGMAKSSHFMVELTLPESLISTESVNMNKVIMFCDQAQLPGISFGTNPVRSYGETKEVPYEKLYEPVNLSFYVDSDMIVKRLFDKWMALVQDPITRDFNYPQRYTTNTINIIVENTQGEEIYMCTLHNCYPKAVAPIQLDYAAKDVMKLSVNLSYQYATMEQLGVTSRVNTINPQIDAQMANYNYGVETFTEIPSNYFTDFNSFQTQFQDLSFGGVKSFSSFEDIGVRTGFGGIFI